MVLLRRQMTTSTAMNPIALSQFAGSS